MPAQESSKGKGSLLPCSQTLKPKVGPMGNHMVKWDLSWLLSHLETAISMPAVYPSSLSAPNGREEVLVRGVGYMLIIPHCTSGRSPDS